MWRGQAMKRVFSFSMLFAAVLMVLCMAMVGQADAVVITNHCTVVGSGTLPDGDVTSVEIVPVDGIPDGTLEYWQSCENTVTSCEEYSGALKGLCNAYCEAMECAGDEPNASEQACETVRGNFIKKGGGELPCEPCYNHFVGNAERMYCWRNGVVLADTWGTGTVNGEPGYQYQVHVQDFGNAGPDYYQITIWATDGTLYNAVGDFLESGDLEVLP